MSSFLRHALTEGEREQRGDRQGAEVMTGTVQQEGTDGLWDCGSGEAGSRDLKRTRDTDATSK